MDLTPYVDLPDEHSKQQRTVFGIFHASARLQRLSQPNITVTCRFYKHRHNNSAVDDDRILFGTYRNFHT